MHLSLLVGALKLPEREHFGKVYESSDRGGKGESVVTSHVFWTKRPGEVHSIAAARAVTAAG
jgi:hypothetical protein